ncbi:MAG: tetratricopeptide repeat protein [Sandaracinaceae bacterium]
MLMRWRGTKVSTVVVLAGVLAGCGASSGGRVIADPPRPPSEEQVAAMYEDASAVFARHDVAGEWDGEACRETLAGFERMQDRVRSAEAHYMSGLTSARCGNAEEAARFYERALRVDASLCEPRVALGVALLERGETGQAAATFERAVEADLRCAPAYVNLSRIRGQDPATRPAALAHLRRALAVRADYLPALDQLALFYFQGSEDAPHLLDLAEMVCRQTQMIAPEHAPLYNTWALVDLARGDLSAAAAKFQRAIALDPTFFEAQMNFGQLTLSQRAYADAHTAFEAARALRPGSYDAVIGAGVAQRGLAAPEEAEQLYIAAREIDPERPEAYFNLAVLYQEHRDGTVAQLQQAEQYLAEFVRRAAGHPRFESTLSETTRWCAPNARRCAQGRAQTLHQSLVLLGAREDGARPAYVR